jgi:hypothetical protein
LEVNDQKLLLPAIYFRVASFKEKLFKMFVTYVRYTEYKDER